MSTVVLPIQSFRFFTYLVSKKRLLFPSAIAFREFSALVDTFILAERITFSGVGAFPVEWETGKLIPTDETQLEFNIHPFEPFHGLDFISPAVPVEAAKDKVTVISGYEEVVQQVYPGLDINFFMVWQYLMSYLDSYNGGYGRVGHISSSILFNLCPKITKFGDNSTSVDTCPYLIQAYSKLSSTYERKIKELSPLYSPTLILPPLTHHYLQLLPDKCTSPEVFISTLLLVRERLKDYRRKFNDYQALAVDADANVKPLEQLRIKLSLEKDADEFAKKFNAGFVDTSTSSFFLDTLSFLTLGLLKGGIYREDIMSKVGEFVPGLFERVSNPTPTVLFNYAESAFKNGQHMGLVQKKIMFNP